MEIKGIVHTHSTYSSDGTESLASLKEFLMQKGISFCCVTEHAFALTTEKAQLFVQECRSLSGSQFVFIPGFEVAYKNAHVLLLGTEVCMAKEADAQLLASWSSRASLAVLAHPSQSKFTCDEVLLDSIDAVEVWNQKYDGKIVPRPHSVQFLRTLQERKQDLMAFGGTDLHQASDFLTPVFTLEVEHMTPEAIMAALKAGSYVFGTKKVAVAASGLWKGKGSAFHNLLSFYSVASINIRRAIDKYVSKRAF